MTRKTEGDQQQQQQQKQQQQQQQLQQHSQQQQAISWLRVHRTSSRSLLAEWRWTNPAIVQQVSRCHILLVRSSSSSSSSDSSGTRRLQVSASSRRCEIKDLAADSTYRVCLQYSLAASNRSDPIDGMQCVDATTKQMHVAAGVGSAIGAVLALLLVAALVLASRRSQRYRKINERQSSAKKVTEEIALNSAGNQAAPPAQQKVQLVMNNADSLVQDASEEQHSSTISDDALTPPTQAPPPPPPPLSPPPPLGTPSLCEPVNSDDNSQTLSKSRDSDSANEQPFAPPAAAAATTATNVTSTAAIADSISSECSSSRQVIQVNDTDEYSIDLRHCSSLSRQQSLKAPESSDTCNSALATQYDVKSFTADSSSVEQQQLEQQQQPQQQQQQEAAMPSLYTQLIETL